jgi:hypothetical protein
MRILYKVMLKSLSFNLNYIYSCYFLLFFLFLGVVEANEIKVKDCRYTNTCIQTFVSTNDYGISARNLKGELITLNAPKKLDNVFILTNLNGEVLKVKLAENVFYFKAIFKGKEILIDPRFIDLFKNLRALSKDVVVMYSKPNSKSKRLTIVPPNEILEIKENTIPLSVREGFIKVKYNNYIGYVLRNNLSDDEYDIRFYNLGIEKILKKNIIEVKHDDLVIKIKINGDDFRILECKVFFTECNAEYKLDRSSYEPDQEALYLIISSSDHKKYLCEITREDILYEFKDLQATEILPVELNPYASCEMKEKSINKPSED